MIFRFCKELGWVEMTCALIIFAFCGVILYKNYPKFKCEAINSEARFALKEIYNAELLYQSEHGHFASFSKLHDQARRVLVKREYFDFYDEIPPKEFSFKIVAKGKPGTLVSGEVWSIDEFNFLYNEVSVCQR